MVKRKYYIENNGYRVFFSDSFIKYISNSFKIQAKEQLKAYIQASKPYQKYKNNVKFN
jgi:hypothetical protein